MSVITKWATQRRPYTCHANQIGKVMQFTYDASGNKASVIYPNGIIIEYGYDNLNCLISVETRTLMSDIIASYAYTLNSKGQRTKVEERVGTQLVRTIDYTYDDADRLTEEQIDDVVTGLRTITYTYDPVGNRLTKDDNGVITTYDYDDNDRLLTEGGHTYGYDNNGNLLSKTGNGEQYNFTYNALNQVVHADINTGGSSSTVEYVYDHDGIRVGKTLNGTDVTTYIVDKNRPYAQVLEEQWTNGALSATTDYVYGDALLSRTTNGTAHFYHYDGMGSTRTLTDMTGAVTDTYSYNAYGNLLDKTGSTINPYLYRGEQFDADLSSYYLRARYYQPGIGRFLTTDHVEGFPNNPITLHRYVYGNGDPIRYDDPSGTRSLIEQSTVVGIILQLAGWGLGVAAVVCEDIADSLAAVLPDAGLVGVSGFISINAKSYLRWIFDTGPIDVLELPDLGSGFGGSGGVFGGVEQVYSISSAQYGTYLFYGLQGDLGKYMGKQYPINAGFTVYHGWIWNLWNTDDYTGPFYSINVGVGPYGGFSLFKDANRSFAKGPFGVSFTLGGVMLGGLTMSGGDWSGGLAKTWYPRELEVFGHKLKTYYSEDARFGMHEVATNFMTIEIVLAALAGSAGNPIGLASSLGSVSLPMTIFAAKETWNSRRPKWNVHQRQTIDRPDDFSSGPQRWILWGGYDF